MHVRTIRTSRRELYDQVWSESVARVAARYDLTENGLRKVCIKHRIPLPPRGYREKIKAGRTVDPTPLPALKVEPGIVLQVGPRPNDGGEGSALFAPADEAERAFPPIVVPPTLTRPHPATVALTEALKSNPDRDGMVRSAVTTAFLVRVHSASIARVLRLVDAVAKGCDNRGFELVAGQEAQRYGGQLRVVVEGFAFDISFNERTRLTPYRPTAAEIDRQRKGRHVYMPVNKFVARGELSLKLDPVWGTRQQGVWTDTKTRLVEERLGEVMLGLRRLAIWRRAEQVWESARQARVDEEQRKRAALCATIDAERQRIEQLEQDAAAWRRADAIRAYAAARAGSGDPDGDPALHQWLAWAGEQADRIDPLRPTPPSILDTPEGDMAPLCAWNFADE